MVGSAFRPALASAVLQSPSSFCERVAAPSFARKAMATSTSVRPPSPFRLKRSSPHLGGG